MIMLLTLLLSIFVCLIVSIELFGLRILKSNDFSIICIPVLAGGLLSVIYCFTIFLNSNFQNDLISPFLTQELLVYPSGLMYAAAPLVTTRPTNATYLHVVANKWLVKMNGHGSVLSVIALLQGELNGHLFTIFNGQETNSPVFLSSSLAKARAINLCKASGLNYMGKFNTKEPLFFESQARTRSLIAVLSDVSAIPSYFSSTSFDVSSLSTKEGSSPAPSANSYGHQDRHSMGKKYTKL